MALSSNFSITIVSSLSFSLVWVVGLTLSTFCLTGSSADFEVVETAGVFLTHLSLLVAGSKSSFFFKSTSIETSDKTWLSSSDNSSELFK